MPQAHDNLRRRWTLRFGSRRLEVGPRPIVMGILNTTPDSFSDGGQFIDPDHAVAHAVEMAAAGALIIDVGGESTRPGAAEVSADEESARVVPVIERLRERSEVLVSIDTRKAAVARAALDAGAHMINDVSALGDPDMPGVVAQADCPVALMHMRGTPKTMQKDVRYEDVVAEVIAALGAALGRCRAAGIDPEQTIVDPGIGFGKTVEHNLLLLRNTDRLTAALGRPVLIGTSRKSFLGRILGAEVDDRLAGTVASCVWTWTRGAAIFRVHDVGDVVGALAVAAAIEQPDGFRE